MKISESKLLNLPHGVIPEGVVPPPLSSIPSTHHHPHGCPSHGTPHGTSHGTSHHHSHHTHCPTHGCSSSGGYPPIITHTAATPQGSPQTSLDASSRSTELNNRLSPSMAFNTPVVDDKTSVSIF